MIVTYAPKGSAQPTVWRFDPRAVRASRAEMIERRWAGGADPDGGPPTYSRWLMALDQGEAKALRVLLWHLLSMEHHTLRLEDVDPALSELTIELTADEIAEQIDTLRRSKLPADRRDRAIAYLESRIADAPDGVGKAV